MNNRIESTDFDNASNDTALHNHPNELAVPNPVNPEGLATAILVNEAEEAPSRPGPHGLYYTAEEVDQHEIWQSRNGLWLRNKWSLSFLVVLVVTGIVIGTIFGVRQSDKVVIDEEDLVLQGGCQRFPQAAQILMEQDVSDRKLLFSPSRTTAQYRALEWLADDDEAKIDLSDEIRVIQRYSRAVVFLSTGGGDTWIETFNFSYGLDECQWNSMRSDLL